MSDVYDSDSIAAAAQELDPVDNLFEANETLKAEVHRLQDLSQQLALDNAKLRTNVVGDAAFQAYRSSAIAKEDRLTAEIARLRAAVIEDAGPVIVGLGQEIQAQRVDLERLRESLAIWQQRFGDCQATVMRMEAVVSAAWKYHRAYMADVPPRCTNPVSSGSHDDHDCLVSLHARVLAAAGALDAVPRRAGTERRIVHVVGCRKGREHEAPCDPIEAFDCRHDHLHGGAVACEPAASPEPTAP